MKIAILKYSTYNIGDDIQSFAVERLLPRVDLRVDREEMEPAETFDSNTKWIINGWFAAHRHGYWTPKTEAQCLFIGIHANDARKFSKASTFPMGCRDLWTYRVCRKNGVPAWLSWCATLTLDLPISGDRKQVVFVDVPPENYADIPQAIVRSARKISHGISGYTKDRMTEVHKRLDLYATAKLLVTGRLHAMLPCLAMGIPVVQVPCQFQQHRFDGYRDFAWTLADAPWESPVPKVSREFIRGLSHSFRQTICDFVES